MNKYCVYVLCFITAGHNIGHILSQTDYGEIDIYNIDRLRLQHEGDTGTLVFKGPTSNSPNPSVIRIQAKPSNYISVNPEHLFSFERCSYGVQLSSCLSSCFQVYMFDAYFYNSSLTYVWNSTWKHFNTSSSVLYIGVCHMTQSSYFRLRFTAIERKFTFGGDSVHAKTGQVASSYFPNFYEQNGEQTTYIFRSRFPTDKVVLEFDDFDVAPGSYLYFDPTKDFTTPVKVTDNTNRLVVVSLTNQLQFIFDHGWPGESYRKHMGFKLTYKFLSESEQNGYQVPITYCGRYYLTLNGGHIDFRPLRFDKPYDCVWVVKTQIGYTGTYMKLDKFSSEYIANKNSDDVTVDIHKGLTSNGTIIGRLQPSYGGVYRDFDDPEGFYIRLRGTFSSTVTFKMAFTSYNNFYTSGCDERDHFRCSSQQCIPGQLACDHIDHCKDKTDETVGCSKDLDNRIDQNTVTVSVIIPVVVSIFLLIVLCIMFVLVRRCRQARQFTSMMHSNGPAVCTSDRNRRRGRGYDYFERPADAPPTYEDALITGIPVPDNGPPKPPSYHETINTVIPEDDFPSPPYTSRENVNDPFLEDSLRVRSDHNDAAPTDVEASAETPRSRQNNQTNPRHKLNLLSNGRLPNLPSINAAVGTQSLCNISHIGQNNNLNKTRSEQILTPKDLGIVNPAFTDDKGQQSRLYKGKAVSSLDLPTTSRQNHTDERQTQSGSGHYRSNIDLATNRHDYDNRETSRGNVITEDDRYKSHSGPSKHGYQRHIGTGQGSRPSISQQKEGKMSQNLPTHRQSAWDRLKPKGVQPNDRNTSACERLKPNNPNLNSKYNNELRRREQEGKKILTNNGSEDREHRAPAHQRDVAENRREQKDNGRDNSREPRDNGKDNSREQRATGPHRERDNRNLSQNNIHCTNENSVNTNPPQERTARDKSKDRPQQFGAKKSSRSENRNNGALQKFRVSGSNPSLNLCDGKKIDVHGSTLSLNENALSFSYRDSADSTQGMKSAGHNASCVSLDNIDEDIDV